MVFFSRNFPSFRFLSQYYKYIQYIHTHNRHGIQEKKSILRVWHFITFFVAVSVARLTRLHCIMLFFLLWIPFWTFLSFGQFLFQYRAMFLYIFLYLGALYIALLAVVVVVFFTVWTEVILFFIVRIVIELCHGPCCSTSYECVYT